MLIFRGKHVRTRKPGRELSDEVKKINKKEEMTLKKKIKFLDRQENVSLNIISKDIEEVKRLKSSIKDSSSLSVDLATYDRNREIAKMNYQELPTCKKKGKK